MIVTAGVGNDTAGATAVRTGLLHREKALLHTHLTDSRARRTGDRFATLLGAAALTGVTRNLRGDIDCDAVTRYSFFEVELQLKTQIGTTKDLRPAAGASATAKSSAATLQARVVAMSDFRPAVANGPPRSSRH